jgi:hypothetical protein
MDDENPNEEDISQAELDEHGDFSDDQYSATEEQSFGSGNYLTSRVKDSIYTFFRHILGLADSSKVANLNKRELGMLDLSVRNCEYIAAVSDVLHNRAVHDFFMAKAEITLATSMSRNGWLPELVVSQKKFSQRTVQPINKQQQKSGFLGLGKKQPEQQPM